MAWNAGEQASGGSLSAVPGRWQPGIRHVLGWVVGGLLAAESPVLASPAPIEPQEVGELAGQTVDHPRPDGVPVAPGPPCGEPIAAVRLRRFDLEYGVNAEALPLTEVALWFRYGTDGEWVRFGVDEDRQSPIGFVAPREGLYAFYFVLNNPTGESGPEPTEGTQPHICAFVDATPPVVQVHTPQPALSMGQRVLRVRWTAVDSNLTPRPIELHYRVLPRTEWQPVQPASQALANTGQYDWRMPETVAGTVEVRITAHDRAGNTTTTASTPVNIASGSDTPAAAMGDGAVVGDSPAGGARLAEARPAVVRPSAADVERARGLYTEGLRLSAGGQPALAVARMRDAIALDPTMTEALVDLGGLLSDLDDPERALDAYRIALSQDPSRREALVGTAEVLVRRRAYSQADEYLTRVVQSNPKDVEVWMHLGDIAVYRGDEIVARDYYQRAATLDPSASAIVEAARRRLANLAALSRNYAQPAE